MTKSKRIGSFLLAVVLTLSCLPISALQVWAADTLTWSYPSGTDTAGETNNAYIITGNKLKITSNVKGDYAYQKLLICRPAINWP